MSNSFTYVSLFSGIGGFEIALSRLGGECVFASEIDRFASQSYKTLYGDSVLHGDITKIDEKDIPEHDLMVGGFPCQSFSVAGNRQGFLDTRGTLFFEVARIAKEKQPKALLLENVKGLVNHDKGNTLKVMLETLSDIGYLVDFTVLNSKFFGVPQNRERIFIVAIRKDLSKETSWVIPEGNTIVPKAKKRHSENNRIKTFNFNYPGSNAVTASLRDILEQDADEKYYVDEEKTALLVKQLQSSEMSDEPTLTDPSQSKREGKVRTYQGVSSTITARIYKEPYMIGQTEENEEVRPVLTPERAEKRQNGRRFKEDGEEAFTLTSQDRHGVAIGQAPRFRIRKLTPLECFRLQGFPDEMHKKLTDAGISDSQLYRQAGNAVTVNVVYEIGKEIVKFIE